MVASVQLFIVVQMPTGGPVCGFSLSNIYRMAWQTCLIGLRWVGLDWVGLAWVGLDWIGLGIEILPKFDWKSIEILWRVYRNYITTNVLAGIT